MRQTMRRLDDFINALSRHLPQRADHTKPEAAADPDIDLQLNHTPILRPKPSGHQGGISASSEHAGR